MAVAPVLYFDGECNLCNGSVQFILRHERRKQILFASLQSEAGEKMIGELPGGKVDSLVLFYNNRYYRRSAAALKVAVLMGGVWVLVGVFYIVPRFIRNAVYDLVARNRYKWFGRKDSCMVPTADIKERFL